MILSKEIIWLELLRKGSSLSSCTASRIKKKTLKKEKKSGFYKQAKPICLITMYDYYVPCLRLKVEEQWPSYFFLAL